MAVLPGRGSVQSGIAVSPFTEAKLIPSTDWEETFPSALSLTAQCHNCVSTIDCGKAALSGSRRRLQSCRTGLRSLSADGCVDIKFVVYFFFHLTVRLLSPVPFPFLHRLDDASRRKQPNFVGRREAELPEH